jgi:hypothetical protein
VTQRQNHVIVFFLNKFGVVTKAFLLNFSQMTVVIDLPQTDDRFTDRICIAIINGDKFLSFLSIVMFFILGISMNSLPSSLRPFIFKFMTLLVLVLIQVFLIIDLELSRSVIENIHNMPDISAAVLFLAALLIFLTSYSKQIFTLVNLQVTILLLSLNNRTFLMHRTLLPLILMMILLRVFLDDLFVVSFCIVEDVFDSDESIFSDEHHILYLHHGMRHTELSTLSMLLDQAFKVNYRLIVMMVFRFRT